MAGAYICIFFCPSSTRVAVFCRSRVGETNSVPGPVGSNWTAVRLVDAAKPPQNARCLDGSPPLYYHSPGFDDGVNKWEIHMEGGAWCGDAQSCTTWWVFRSSRVDPEVLLPDAQVRCLAVFPSCSSLTLSSLFRLRRLTPTR